MALQFKVYSIENFLIRIHEFSTKCVKVHVFMCGRKNSLVLELAETSAWQLSGHDRYLDST